MIAAAGKFYPSAEQSEQSQFREEVMVSPQKKIVLLNKFKSVKKYNINSINSQVGIDTHTKTGKHIYIFKKEKNQRYCVLYNIAAKKTKV